MRTAAPPSAAAGWRFAVDRGGTFTDVVGFAPDGSIHTADGWQIPHEVDEAIAYLENADGTRRDAAAPFCLFLSWSPPHTMNQREGVPASTSVRSRSGLRR